MIARIEHGPRGANPRFVVTSLAGDGRDLYERLYCARAEMENRIKEQQLQLFADRHLVPPMVAQPVPPAARQPRLHLDRRDPPARARRYRHGPRPMRHHPPQAAQDRRGDHPQHRAGALPLVVGLPRAGPLPSGRRPAQTRITQHPARAEPPDPGRATGNPGARPQPAKTARQRPPVTEIPRTKPPTPTPQPKNTSNPEILKAKPPRDCGHRVITNRLSDGRGSALGSVDLVELNLKRALAPCAYPLLPIAAPERHPRAEQAPKAPTTPYLRNSTLPWTSPTQTRAGR